MDTYPIDTEEATRVNIRTQALINDAFLRVIHTGPHEQIVVMTLPLDGESGEKVSPDTDQFFVFVDGLGEARVGAYVLGVEPGDLIYVPAGTRCNIVNRAVAPLRLIAVYGPPALEPGAIYWTREEAPVLHRGLDAACTSSAELPAWFVPTPSSVSPTPGSRRPRIATRLGQLGR